MAGQASAARRRLEVAGGTLALLLAAWWVYAPALRGGWLWDDREDVPDNVVLKVAGGLKYIWSGRFGLDYYPLKSTVQWVQWRWWGDATAGYHETNVALHVVSGVLLAMILQRFFAIRWWWSIGAALLWVVHPVAVGAVAWIAELKDALSCTLLLGSVWFYLDYDRRGGAARYAAALIAFVAAMLAKSGVMMLPVWLLGYHLARRRWASFPSAVSGRGDVREKVDLTPGERRASTQGEEAARVDQAMPHVGRRRERRTARHADLRGGDAASAGDRPSGDANATAARVCTLVAPFLGVTVALGLVAVRLQGGRSMGADGVGLGGLGFRVVLACRALLFYFWHSVWPAHPSPVYERWAVPGGAAGVLAMVVMAGLLVSLVAVWILRPRWGLPAVLGVGWFVLNLAPVLGLVGISFMRFTWVMDHFAYVPLLGLCALVAAGLQALEDRAAFWRVPAGIALAGAIGACAFVSRGYAHAYQGEEQIWTYAAEHEPNTWAPQSNLGAVLLNRGQLDAAELHLRAAIRLEPAAPDAHRNLAVVFADRGKPQQAIPEELEALRLRPGYALAEQDLVRDYFATGQLNEALTHAVEAIRLVPNNPDSRNDAAVVLIKLGRLGDAAKQLEAAVQLAPQEGRFQSSLGVTLGQLGRVKEALPHFEAAARLMPQDAAAQQNVRVARQMLGP